VRVGRGPIKKWAYGYGIVAGIFFGGLRADECGLHYTAAASGLDAVSGVNECAAQFQGQFVFVSVGFDCAVAYDGYDFFHIIIYTRVLTFGNEYVMVFLK
jgi:hypothetical protein